MSQGEGKARYGNYFEDFAVGQVLTHATPRTDTVAPGQWLREASLANLQ
jgi:acyl dehydratase